MASAGLRGRLAGHSVPPLRVALLTALRRDEAARVRWRRSRVLSGPALPPAIAAETGLVMCKPEARHGRAAHRQGKSSWQIRRESTVSV